MAKYKLASVNKKAKSIPKLELQTVLIASRLKQKITKELKILIKEIFLWTDSKINLHYLQNKTKIFGIYISHRIDEILENTGTSPLNLILQTKQVDIKLPRNCS